MPLAIGERAEGGVRAQLDAVRAALNDVAGGVVSIASHELAEVVAGATAVVAAAEAARAALVLEASSRGVIAASDHPRPRAWVEQSCREAGVPVTKGQARQLHDVTTTCAGPDAAGLREAVTRGRLPLETAAVVAKIYRRLRVSIRCPHWDELLEVIIDWAAEGASAQRLAELEDPLIGQYGTATELDDAHEREYYNRDFSGFRRDRSGMLAATIRLDPASEAVITAAIHALSAPHLDGEGNPDPRTTGQRRADALVTLAHHATTADPTTPGTGSKARVTVTIGLPDLMAGLGTTRRGDGRSGSTRGIDAREAAGSARDANQKCCTPTSIDTTCRTPACDEAHGHGVTGFGQVLSPNEARMLACDAKLVPAVLGGRGELLDLGRSTRLVTPALVAALHLRDGGCTYPGCTAPPSWCDGHHIVYWALGGRTDMSNLTLLCRHHHTVVHQHHHTATIDPRGVVRWTGGDGRPLGNTPRRAAPWPRPPEQTPSPVFPF